MDQIHLYLVGPAGCGKSTLCHGFKSWMDRMGYSVQTINLDPGVKHLPYAPDVDVRDLFSLDDIMEQYNLGPNGAQIVAADLIALRASEIKEIANKTRSDYIVIDTPGQMELFTFRDASNVFINTMNKERSAIVFIYDPMLSVSASNFVSLLLLCATTQFRFFIPTINVLSKTDVLKEEQLECTLKWSLNSDALYDALIEESPTMREQVGIELLKALESLGTYSELIPVSAKEVQGMEDLYNRGQQIFMGGEDLSVD